MQRENRYRASQHFVWRQDLPDILGEGAFGTVFKGVHKETGEPVAVKTFNRNNQRSVSQYRELDIIKRLDHPNIVKLIAIEEVLKPRRPEVPVGIVQTQTASMQGKVLIMELCTEENLYANLDRPENQFGLEESEFLLVLAHMTAGLRYLHQNKIIHRDWKPSNILKTVSEDGLMFYKLCDFGAARVCEENGQFMSIVGTEEYLHPEIYRRALLGGSNGVFMATSDLWSIGVTLYQTATALLPFRPYGGRKNREIMHKMTSNKESGVIAGYQDTENGPIYWRKELPIHCHLSSGLRPLVTKLLAGLLESKQPLLWNYERYFHEVSKILSKIPIRFYVLGESTYRTAYVDQGAEFYAFRDELASQIDSIVNEYALFADQTLLEADNWDIVHYMKNPESLVIVAPLGDKPIQFNNLNIPLTPSFIEHDQPTLDWDADTAKTCLNVARWINVHLGLRREVQRATVDNADQIRHSFAQRLQSACQEWSAWKFSWSILQKNLKLIETALPSISRSGALAAKHSSAQLISQMVSSLEKQVLNLKSQCMDFSKSHIPADAPQKEKQEILAMEQTLENMEKIYTQFRKDKAMRMDHNLDTFHNDLKWHGLQKKQLKRHWQWCKDKFDNAERDQLKLVTQKAIIFYQAAYRVGKTLADVELGIRNVEEIMREFNASLEKVPTNPLSAFFQLPVGPVGETPTVTPSSATPRSQVGPASQLTPTVQFASTRSSCSVESVKLSNSFLNMVKEIQELRGVAQENRQLMERISSTPTS